MQLQNNLLLVYLIKIEFMSNEALNYTCPKCGNRSYEVGQMRATGGFFSKIFDIQTEKFTSVTCERCKYTDFYKAPTAALSNIFDFFTS